VKHKRGLPLVSQRKEISNAIVRNLGLLDSIENGLICRICNTDAGVLAYHIIPQVTGYSARFDPENVVWACKKCNGREYFYRIRGRAHEIRKLHIQLFGAQTVERLEKLSLRNTQYSTAQLKEMLTDIRMKVSKMGRSPA